MDLNLIIYTSFGEYLSKKKWLPNMYNLSWIMVDAQLFLHSQLVPRRENTLSRIQKAYLRPHCVTYYSYLEHNSAY
jgi:hypothetical protein